MPVYLAATVDLSEVPLKLNVALEQLFLRGHTNRLAKPNPCVNQGLMDGVTIPTKPIPKLHLIFKQV